MGEKHLQPAHINVGTGKLTLQGHLLFLGSHHVLQWAAEAHRQLWEDRRKVINGLEGAFQAGDREF